MTDESKAKLEQIKLALKAEKDANKLLADGAKALEKAKEDEKDEKDEKAEKEAKKATYKALIAENKDATTVAKLASVVDKLLKELSK